MQRFPVQLQRIFYFLYLTYFPHLQTSHKNKNKSPQSNALVFASVPRNYESRIFFSIIIIMTGGIL